MSFDPHTNFAYATVALAPSPASSGTSLTVAAGLGALFAAVPCNATVWPAGLGYAILTNAEIVRVTARVGDVLTIVREQELQAGSSPRVILAGDQLAITITAKTLTDIETAGSPPFTIANGSALALNAALVEMIGVNPNGLLVLGGDVVLAKAVVATMDRDQLGIDSNALEIHGTAGAAPVRLEAFSFFNTDVSIDVIAQGAGTINLTSPVVASNSISFSGNLPVATNPTTMAGGDDGAGDAAILFDNADSLIVLDFLQRTIFDTEIFEIKAQGNIGIQRLSGVDVLAGLNITNASVAFFTGFADNANTNPISIETGEAVASGNSGNITLTTGQAGGGIRGNIALNAPSTVISGTVTAGAGFVFPTSDPGIPGAWWNNAGTLVMSV